MNNKYRQIQLSFSPFRGRLGSLEESLNVTPAGLSFSPFRGRLGSLEGLPAGLSLSPFRGLGGLLGGLPAGLPAGLSFSPFRGLGGLLGGLLLLLLLTLSSCFSDKTTNGDMARVSEITVTAGIDSVYNIRQNEELTIAPTIRQSAGDLEVTYEWEMDMEVVASGPVFKYTGKKLGAYTCRLILSNVHGKTYVPFTINVNSRYEEGLTVLSTDANGSSSLSFLLTPTDGSEAQFYDEEAFSACNPDIPFATNAVDMVQSRRLGNRVGNLVVVCQGTGYTGTDVPTIYFLNEKTFAVENIVTTTDFPTFKPTRLALPFNNTSGGFYPILSADGKAYDYGAEGVVSRPTLLQYTYANACAIVDSHTSYAYASIFWDSSTNCLCELYNGYGPFYASNVYHANRDSITTVTANNYFGGKRQLMAMVKADPAPGTEKTEATDIIVLTKSQLGVTPIWTIERAAIHNEFWVYSYDEGVTKFSAGDGIKSCGTIAPATPQAIYPDTPIAAGKKYHALYYAKDNTVKRWNYTTKDQVTAAATLSTVGTAQSKITGLLLSSDQDRLYVSSYDPTVTSGKNGSVTIIDADTGEKLHEYLNVCYKPVKMIYKEK